jgi:hypothetical protein
MYSILKSSTNSNHTPLDTISKPSIVDFNKYQQTEFCPRWKHLQTPFQPDACRHMPESSSRRGSSSSKNEFIKMKTVCFSHVTRFLQDEIAGKSNLTANVDLIVLALGAWDVGGSSNENECGKYTTKKSALERLQDLLQVAAQFTQTAVNKTGKKPRPTRIVWRTAGFGSDSKKIQTTVACNDLIMNTIDHNEQQDKAAAWPPPPPNNLLTYINWGGAVQARSFGKERIAGDTWLHYGPEPRVVLVQMLTNHLQDLKWFSRGGGSSSSSAVED